MNESDVMSASESAIDRAQVEAAPEVATSAPDRPEVAAAQSSGWSGGRIAALAIGTLLGLVALALFGAGGTVLWADRTQRDGGYITTDLHSFSTAGSALATVRTELGSAGTGWLYAPALLDQVRIRVTPSRPEVPLFVGIAPSDDVDRYLAGVKHTVISEFFRDKVEPRSGAASVSPPASKDFWVAASSGTGTRTLTWDPVDGSWTVVVMNADGRPGVDVRADLGARVPALPWIGVGVLVAGVVFAAGSALLVAGAVRRPRR